MSDLISRQAAEEKLKKVVDETALIFADIREKNVDDSVCGLCEYDCDHGMDGYAYECPGFERDDCFKLEEKYRKEWTDMSDVPSVEPERKGGKWIMPVHDDGMSDPIYYQVRCSKCGFDLDPQTWHMELHKYGADKYCPKCGAKMEVDG